MKFIVVEKASYEVEAEDIDQAEELFIENGPETSGVESPVKFISVDDREIGEPDKPETWRETR